MATSICCYVVLVFSCGLLPCLADTCIIFELLGLKKYSDWPTYPQLYGDGELIGGLDIIRELVETGELKSQLPQQVLKINNILSQLVLKINNNL